MSQWAGSAGGVSSSSKLEIKPLGLPRGVYGIFRIAEYFLLLGARLKDLRPEIKTHRQVLAKYELTAHR
jgi:hypothetical protein